MQCEIFVRLARPSADYFTLILGSTSLLAICCAISPRLGQTLHRIFYLDFGLHEPLSYLTCNLPEVGPDLTQNHVHPLSPLYIREEDPAGQLVGPGLLQQLLLQLMGGGASCCCSWTGRLTAAGNC
jgi:hypothetical protein